MIKKFLLLIFISYSFSLSAETKSYIDYFRKINKAELYVASSNYADALAIYKDLDKNYPHTFYKDIHNATLCAINLKQYEEVLKFSNELVKQVMN